MNNHNTVGSNCNKAQDVHVPDISQVCYEYSSRHSQTVAGSEYEAADLQQYFRSTDIAKEVKMGLKRTVLKIPGLSQPCK